MRRASENPVEVLGLQPLIEFRQLGGKLEPGQVLQAYPPFSTKEAEAGVQLSPVSVLQAIHGLAELARFTATLRPGERFRIKPR